MPFMNEMFRYVALGDSTGVGTGARDGGYVERLFQRLRAQGVHAGLLNLCQNGATTYDARAQAERAASKRPALVTLGVGSNDAWRLTPLSAFEENLKHIGDSLERSRAHVLVCNIADFSLSPIAAAAGARLNLPTAMLRARIEGLNAVIGSLGQRPRFEVIDLFSLSQQVLPTRPDFFCPDGFHPSAAGYDHWAEVLWPHVEKVSRGWFHAASGAA
jgi:lysophospholipase L1-like esterase